MTVEQIAHAFAAGQLTLRTPLWPPGTSGWQALGNFEQFQSGAFAPPQGYSQLSHFEEADDDPTRMWTGTADLSELPGMEPMAPVPSGPPVQQRPSASTGPRQLSTREPTARSLPAPAPAARIVSTSGSATSGSAASGPAAAVSRSMRPRRSSGLWLVAGLVGLVGLGSAVLAARGNWSLGAPSESNIVAASTPTPEPVRAATQPSTVNEPSPAAAPSPAEAKAETPKPADTAAVPPAGTAEPAAEVNQARLAKYEDTQASAFVAEAQPVTKKRATESKSATRETVKSKASEPKTKAAEAKQGDETASPAKEAAKESSKVSSAPAKHAAVAAPPAAKAKPHPAEAKVEKVEKVEKAEAKPEAVAVSSAVNDAAAAALGNSAKLASSCRPPGGASGAGKARIIYSNDGEVQSVEILTAKFRDTLTGSCVRMVFRRAKIPPFKGEPPTFIKSFTIPEE